MSKDNKAQMITIDDKEYDTADFTEEQVVLTNHCLDLDRKISNMNFQLQQLQVGKRIRVRSMRCDPRLCIDNDHRWRRGSQ
jgi:hypothetical protein